MSDEDERPNDFGFPELRASGQSGEQVFEHLLVAVKKTLSDFMDAYGRDDVDEAHAWNAIALMATVDNMIHAFRCANQSTGLLIAGLTSSDLGDDDEESIWTPEELLRRILGEQQEGDDA